MSTRVTVIEPHSANYPNPVRFLAGDHLTIGERTSEYEGWIWIATREGNQGWAPNQYVDVAEGDTAVALLEYDATELNTSPDEILTLHFELNDWGWVEREDGACGWVPMNTIKPNRRNG